MKSYADDSLQQVNREKQNLLRVMCTACSLVAMSGPTYAENWTSLSGAETLRDFVSGAKVEIDLKPDVTATGEYFPDGTAKIEAWGETFPRTWEVRNDNQVCYMSVTETNCYSFEQNLDAPGEFRAALDDL